MEHRNVNLKKALLARHSCVAVSAVDPNLLYDLLVLQNEGTDDGHEAILCVQADDEELR